MKVWVIFRSSTAENTWTPVTKVLYIGSSHGKFSIDFNSSFFFMCFLFAQLDSFHSDGPIGDVDESVWLVTTPILERSEASAASRDHSLLHHRQPHTRKTYREHRPVTRPRYWYDAGNIHQLPSHPCTHRSLSQSRTDSMGLGVLNTKHGHVPGASLDGQVRASIANCLARQGHRISWTMPILCPRTSLRTIHE